MDLKQLQSVMLTKTHQEGSKIIHVEGGPLQDPLTSGITTMGEQGKTAESSCEGGSVNTSTTCSTFCSTFDTTETRPQEHQQERRRKRVVRFNTVVSQRKIPCINDYSREEIEQCWFLPEESFQITQRCIKEIIMLEEGTRLKDKKYCARGLETSTKLAQKAKTLNRRAAFDAVLDEQDEQDDQNDGDFDDEAMADMYREVSKSCQMWAHVVAMQDQREAELIYDEDDC